MQVEEALLAGDSQPSISRRTESTAYVLYMEVHSSDLQFAVPIQCDMANYG